MGHCLVALFFCTMNRMMGTIAIGRPLSSVPQWVEMLERHRKASLFERGDTLIALGGMTWNKFKSQMKGKTDMEKIKAVNDLWNQRPWKADKKNWGIEDKWATPLEFCMKGGDCEDYAVAKMLSLKALDVQCPMRLAIGEINGKGHAVLAVEVDGRILILDNDHKELIDADKYPMKLRLSLNEERAWGHVQAKQVK